MKNCFSNYVNGIITFRSFCSNLCKIFLKYIYLFLKRGNGKEKERDRNTVMREKHRSVATRVHGMNQHAGTGPDRRPFTVGDDAQPTGPHWSGKSRVSFD